MSGAVLWACPKGHPLCGKTRPWNNDADQGRCFTEDRDGHPEWPGFCSWSCLDDAGDAELAEIDVPDTISRAGQPVTAEHDRSACKAWCGRSYVNSDCPVSLDGNGEAGVFLELPWKFSGPARCSARCRDLRLPPMDERAGVVVTSVSVDGIPIRGFESISYAGSASPANVPPVPAVGQRWSIALSGQDAGDATLADLLSGSRIRWWRKNGTSFDSQPGAWPLGDVAKAAFEGRATYIGLTPTDARTVPWPAGTPVTVKHPAGITCRHCLRTSEHGDQHLETCTARDFAPGYRDLTSEEWTLAVSNALRVRADIRAEKAEPFVPSISDEELFGRPVRE